MAIPATSRRRTLVPGWYRRRVRLAAVARRVRTGRQLRRPPACPPGSRIGPPDFVGIGAQRSGTTWWHHLVVSHPAVSSGAPKELHFFHPYWQRELTDADVATYARYFPRPPGLLAGEWSPGYLAHFWIPPMLRRAAPEARLLVVLRDPVERYRSGLALSSETRRPGAAAASAAFRLGCYGLQLEHVFRSFDRDRVLVLQFERCVADPASELARTYRFLGVDDGHRPSDLAATRNAARGSKPPLPDGHRAALVDAYRPDVERLTGLVPDLDLDLWENFASRARGSADRTDARGSGA